MFQQLSYVLLFFYLLFTFVPVSYSNSQLKPYAKEVIKLTKQYCKPGQYNNPTRKFLYFYKLYNGEIGTCATFTNNYAIQIDPSYWNHATEDERWELLYHEMAHCILFKHHVDNPMNYMYPYTNSLTKETVIKQFIQDLKEHCNGK